MPSSNKVRKVTSENYPTERGQEADKYKGLRGSYWGQRALADMGEHLALFGAKAVTTFWGGMGHL